MCALLLMAGYEWFSSKKTGKPPTGKREAIGGADDRTSITGP
jgi:hypothetical protein